MKPQKTKTEFIRLRAEGRSYSYIADTLHISKSTCTKWERELKAQIAELRQEQLNELYSAYAMTKEARIKKLGDTLGKINAALEKTDFTAVDPAKLLDYKLKYMEALKGEYIGTKAAIELDNVDAKSIVAALADLLNRVRAGDITAEQAQEESGILAQLLKAYDTVEVQAKLDELEAIIGGGNNGRYKKTTQ